MDPIRLKKNDKYNVLICANCFKHQHKGKMIPTKSVDEAVYDMLEQRFKNAKKVELYVPEHKQNPGIMVEAEAVVDKKWIVPIFLLYTICPNCSKLLGQAYNGILQLRNPTKEILKFTQDELKKATKKNVHCIKEEDTVNGMDYRITDAQWTRAMGKNLQGTFGGELKETAKLVSRSRETSKDLYRVTMMFRYPWFKKGDVVSYRGREVIVLNFAKKVYIQDVKTNKKSQVPYDQIQKR
ncbi:MAG TPA: NMD3-related protein [Candidatus Nanoarchaeia archaeon]|nr:NMD3-related protein [Candidatus Nanoarchaeia archaeon]